MSAPLHSHLDHVEHPEISRVELGRPLQWLQRGWSDFTANLATSVLYGAFYAVLGYLILSFTADLPYLFTAAISGFLLVGPLAAAGLYEVSRRHETGQSCGLRESMQGLARNADSLLYFGIMLALFMIGWERLSAILFALFYDGNVPDLQNFFAAVFLSGEYVHFVVAYMLVGGALALLLFTLSVVSVPMMMDRDVDIVTALSTSVHAVGHNLGAMVVWGLAIVLLVAVGFATYMLGLIITLPLLGHATWHAYRDLVKR